MTHLSPSTIRLDAPTKGKPCGASHIPSQKNCTKGSSTPTKQGNTALTAGAIGLGVAAAGAGAFALSRNSSPKTAPKQAPNPWDDPFTPRPPRPKKPAAPSATPALPGRAPLTQLRGSAPRALLPPAPPRKSKTQRMRENTAAAMRNAEGRIAQTAREEVRRVAQIGNTMAAAGEATGMAAKTTLRELRLRTEAARRRFEPGYRSPDQRRLPGSVQAQLPGAGLTPERVAIPVNPRTGQPRRKKARGFGRSDGGVTFYSTTYIDPARQ